MAYQPDPALEVEISRLDGLGLRELRDLWAQRLGAVPGHRSADLVRQRLAYELQVRAYGGLKSATRKRLLRMHEALKRNSDYKPVPNYKLPPGTMLAREWRGMVYRVGVMDSGYEYRGQRFGSLSEIAHCITGVRRSGPLFFGLTNVNR